MGHGHCSIPRIHATSCLDALRADQGLTTAATPKQEASLHHRTLGSQKLRVAAGSRKQVSFVHVEDSAVELATDIQLISYMLQVNQPYTTTSSPPYQRRQMSALLARSK